MMIKALFKKQMMESFSWLYMSRKNGKKRTPAGLLLFALLYLFVFGYLGVAFYFMAAAMGETLIPTGFGWFYMALMGLISTVLGVVGSVFTTYSSLYQAKDNDLLLSMPIPTRWILTIRLSGVYFMGLLYEAVVMIPALIVWFRYACVEVAGILFSLLIPFVISLFVLTLSCILGGIVAWISSHIRHKNLVTVILSLGFIGGYYYLYFMAYSSLGELLLHMEDMAKGVKNILFPLYHMGLAAEGSLLSMVIFSGMVLSVFAIVYLVLSRSFLTLATTNKGAVKAVYKEGKSKAGTLQGALLYKEWKRFSGSATYMMNCGLGSILILIAAVAVLIKGGTLLPLVNQFFGSVDGLVPLMAAAAICTSTTMNDITAPSVSLEGKSIWLVQSLPVTGWQVLKAKLQLHLLLTWIPAAILVICVEIVLKPSLGFALLIPIAAALFILFMAQFGLFLNLKMPNLNWTNETAPVKQGFSVAVALFGGWILVTLFGFLYYFIMDYVPPLLFLGLASLLLLLGCVGMNGWLKGKGARIFETL